MLIDTLLLLFSAAFFLLLSPLHPQLLAENPVAPRLIQTGLYTTIVVDPATTESTTTESTTTGTDQSRLLPLPTSLLLQDQPTPILPYGAAQEFPDIDDGRVVWQDARAGATDIYLWSPAETAARNLTSSNEWEVQPALDGDLLVWKDGYQGIGIHGLRLQSGTFFTVTVGQRETSRPRLSGQTVVWAADGGDGDWNIYGYDIGSTRQFVIDDQPGNQFDPQIDWPLVVWWDDQEHIYLHNLQNGVTRTLFTTHGARRPTVSALDQLVVWQDQRNGDWDLYGFDLRLNHEVALVVAPDDQEAVVLANGLLAYQSHTESGSWNIGLWVRALNNTFLLDRQPGYQTQPAVDGTTIVWQDSRTHQLNIFAYQWSGAIPSLPTQPVAPPANLQVGAQPKGEIVLHWDDLPDNEAGFTVERTKGITGTTWQELVQLPADSTTYIDSTPEVGESYWYRVQAFNQEGVSFYSNESFGSAFGQVPTTEELYLMTLINAARADPAAYGYPDETPTPPLVYNPVLAYAAHSHSQSILNAAFQFGHCDIVGRCPTERARAVGYQLGCAENLITTHTTDLAAMDDANTAFLASDGHRRTMLASDLTEFGVGHTFDPAKGDAGRHGQVTEVICGGQAVPIPPLPDGIMIPPSAGDVDFTFLVNFYSAAGNVPLIKEVIVDGTTYAMTLLSGTAAHGTYILKIALDARIKHQYFFRFRDSNGTDVFWAPPGTRLLGNKLLYLPVVVKQ